MLLYADLEEQQNLASKDQTSVSITHPMQKLAAT